MPPKGVSKAVSKRCPNCKKPIPVATRLCTCGHQFFEERRRSNTAITPPLDQSPDIEEITPLRGASSNSDTNSDQHHSHTSGSPNSMLGVSNISTKGGGGNSGGGSAGSGECSVSAAAAAAAAAAEGGKRRSVRVKREKPNFYDALEYENQMRKARRERQKDDPQVHTTASGRAKRERRQKNSSPDEDEDEPVVKEKKRRKKQKKIKKEEEEEVVVDEDIMADISPQIANSFAFVLADINRKLGLNNPVFT